MFPAAFTKQNYHALCDDVAARDPDLRAILDRIGYPPYWVRTATFATLVLTILEQQVSLASAFATFRRLQAHIGPVRPESFLKLGDEEIRGLGFTRQKTAYVRGLAKALTGGELRLGALRHLSDEAVRERLTRLKGIGTWTADIYLLHVLRRTDVFPLGDLALVSALREVKSLPKDSTKEEMLRIAAPWQPLRSLATLILWHHYLSRRRGIALI